MGTRSLSRPVRLCSVLNKRSSVCIFSPRLSTQKVSSVAATWIWGEILGQVECFRASLDSASSMQVSGPRGSVFNVI